MIERDEGVTIMIRLLLLEGADRTFESYVLNLTNKKLQKIYVGTCKNMTNLYIYLHNARVPRTKEEPFLLLHGVFEP